MNCNSCATYYNIGCFGHCGSIDTGFVATQAGTHQVVVSFLGARKVVEADFEVDEAIVIPNGTLNEDSEAYFTIIMPDGEDFTHSANEIDYTCFKVTTKISF